MLYLHGDRDGALNPRYFAVVEGNVTPASRTALIPDVGHFLHLEQPRTVSECILRFLDTQVYP